MTQIPLYQYPFDEEGHETLSFDESIGAMRELERQLNLMLKPDWRWCDLRLKVTERHPLYVIYDIEHHGESVGRAVVRPFNTGTRKIGLESTINNRTLHHKIRPGREPEGA